jgi:hypothetical protein
MPNPTPGDTPTPRHSGLDPESRIVNSRRKAPQEFPLPLAGRTASKNLIDELDSGLSQQ